MITFAQTRTTENRSKLWRCSSRRSTPQVLLEGNLPWRQTSPRSFAIKFEDSHLAFAQEAFRAWQANVPLKLDLLRPFKPKIRKRSLKAIFPIKTALTNKQNNLNKMKWRRCLLKQSPKHNRKTPSANGSCWIPKTLPRRNPDISLKLQKNPMQSFPFKQP